MKNKYLFKAKKFLKRHVIIAFTILLLLSLLVTLFISQYFNVQHKDRYTLAEQSSVTPVIPKPLVFRDSTTGDVLTIQLAQGLATTGQFTFYVPQKGYYGGTMPLLQSGQQIVHPQGQITGKFMKLSGGIPGSTTIKMEGEMNTNHNTATINIWIDGTKYQLQTATIDTTQATAVAKQSVSYTTSHNWPGLYSLFTPEVQATTSQTQFSDLMSSSSATIVSADLNGAGQSTNVGGYSYFTQPITVTIQKSDGTTTTYHSTEYFVYEQGAWKLLTTDTLTQ